MNFNSGWSYREQVDTEGAGRTVLAHFVATHRHSSARDWTERIERGEVEVDDVSAALDTILRAGQWVTWHRPPWHEPEVPSHFEVIHEDDAIVAVTKPSGLPTMPAGGFLEHTLLALVRARYPEANPLHRLGRFTSGLVVFARTAAAAAALARLWRAREVKKHYRALGSGIAALDTFSIDAAIGRVPHPTLGEVYAASANGKPSHSIATVLERRPRHGRPANEGTTLFAVEITTGRPHQIRIHLACAGHPLAGDPLYDIGGGIRPQPGLHPTTQSPRGGGPGLPGDGGYLLHAERLSFIHPLTEAVMILAAPPPLQLISANDLEW